MRVVATPEYYRHLFAALSDERAPDLAAFLALDQPDIFVVVEGEWNTSLLVSRANPYRRSVIDIRHGVACTVEALLRPDGVIELERISFDWDFPAE